MKCCIKDCNNKAIGILKDPLMVKGKRRVGAGVLIPRCREHEVKHQAWKRRRESEAENDKNILELANAGDLVVRQPQIQHSHDGKCINNIELRLKEIYVD